MRRRCISPAEKQQRYEYTIKRVRSLYWRHQMTLQQIRAHIDMDLSTAELRAIVLYKHHLHIV